MNLNQCELLPSAAVSITDASMGVVFVLCALFMLVPFAMFVGLVYSGLRRRTRDHRG
jgi:hypothetical protein